MGIWADWAAYPPRRGQLGHWRGHQLHSTGPRRGLGAHAGFGADS